MGIVGTACMALTAKVHQGLSADALLAAGLSLHGRLRSMQWAGQSLGVTGRAQQSACATGAVGEGSCPSALVGLLSLKLDLTELPHRHSRLPCPVSFLNLIRDALLQHLQTSQASALSARSCGPPSSPPFALSSRPSQHRHTSSDV